MKVLFVDTVNPLLMQTLESANILCDIAYSKSKEKISKIIHKYDGIVIRSKFEIDKRFIDIAKKLKFIARAGSGTENIDVEYAMTKNISCFNAAEGNRQAVAEHTLAMILALINNINQANLEVKKGQWNRESNRGTEISGKKIGIIGFGNNGNAFANLLKGFDVTILAYDKYKKEYDYKTDMATIYKKADFLSLHVPLTHETKYLVNDNFISKFHKPFYLINTSRGKCVDTKALVKNLEDKKILGACLDVLEQEKISFENLAAKKNTKDLTYLLKAKNVILTPHIAGWTKESDIKIAEILAQKIINQSNSIKN
ncbi:MAG: NAD(P)-dependent oxidoreductase [Flavobacteriales bacterium]|jgi:D-3-phosphoglycerate dehydrogenase